MKAPNLADYLGLAAVDQVGGWGGAAATWRPGSGGSGRRSSGSSAAATALRCVAPCLQLAAVRLTRAPSARLLAAQVHMPLPLHIVFIGFQVGARK
jgi:hypothetical protein